VDVQAQDGHRDTAVTHPPRHGGGWERLITRLARRLGPPPGLLATVHWMFVIIGEALLLAYLIE
jgi:hypothetical protein